PITIALLIVALLLVGAGISAVIFFSFLGGFSTNSPFDVRNISSEVEESKTLQVDSGKPLTLKVVDAAGEITVTGADVEEVEVRVVKTAYDSTQARADEEVKGVKYSIEQSGNIITLTYELPKSMNFSNNVNTVDFIVTVPIQTSVDAETSFGDIRVDNLEGSVAVQNDFGEVSVLNITGAVSVSSNGGTLTATSIKAGTGDIELHSEFGSITLEKANGRNITLDTNSGSINLNEVRATSDLTANTQFGDVTFENGSAASVSIENNGGAVSLLKLNIKDQIKVQDQFGNIKLDQALSSSYDLHTNSGAITIDGAEGDLKAHTDFGNIEIANAESVTLDVKTNSGSILFSGLLGVGPHNIKTDFGGIDLSLSGDAKLDVDLKTDFGSISSDIPITVTLNGDANSNGGEIIGIINGGGDQLTVQTSSGSINIKAVK
ncbi:MAG TPA: DUF4097 family beta strand repeat-containing protein, partial [Anaerolineales bacterium]|nr:DUF4097 family beta strand repeat-containing protein [Anaerolineales bacterium]